MARVHLLTSSAALVLVHLALALDFPTTPVWPSGACTDKSLTIPSWTISDYKSSSSGTTFSFTNSAAGTTGWASCSSSACTVSGDAKLSASLSSDSGGPLVSLKESWDCSDLGRTLHFEATGKASIFSLHCSGTECSSPIPYLAYGSLSAPVPLTPAQPPPSKGYNTSSCLDADRRGLWTVSNVSFKNYTEYQCSNPAGGYCLSGDAVSPGVYLKLRLTNNAINWSVDCDLTISEHPFSPLKNTPISCASGGFNDISANVAWTGVAPNFQLQVDNVWYCLDNPKTNVIPSAILATGSGSVPLDCTFRPGNSGHADDVITICTLASNSRAIDAKLVKRESEPAFSLVTAPPASGGCTVNSILNPTWRVLPTFKTYIAPPWSPNNSSLWEVVVRLGNPAYQHDFFSTPGPQGLPGRSDPHTVYYCDWGEVGFRLPWNCTFAFDWNNYKLWLNDVWECNEKDATHPLYFTGEGTIDLSSNSKPICSINKNPDLYSCYWQDTIEYSIPKVTVGLTNVSPPRGNKALLVGR